MKNRGFEGLVVWQRARELAVSVYRQTATFPAHEQYNLASQMRRAATSVMSNIAEGHGSDTPKDFVRFLYMSRGSLMELRSCLILAEDLGYSVGQHDAYVGRWTQPAKCLTGLLRS